MRFHTLFDERPYCAWADLKRSIRLGDDIFGYSIVRTTQDQFEHMAPLPQQAALLAFDRLRMQQLLGPTSDKVNNSKIHLKNRVGVLINSTMFQINEALWYETGKVKEKLFLQREYYDWLKAFIGKHTSLSDPFAAHQAKVKKIAAFRTSGFARLLPDEIIDAITQRPELKLEFDYVV
jgi:hypothetical protein